MNIFSDYERENMHHMLWVGMFFVFFAKTLSTSYSILFPHSFLIRHSLRNFITISCLQKEFLNQKGQRTQLPVYDFHLSKQPVANFKMEGLPVFNHAPVHQHVERSISALTDIFLLRSHQRSFSKTLIILYVAKMRRIGLKSYINICIHMYNADRNKNVK